MIRKLLLLLVVITYLQNTYAQQGEVLVQTFFSNAGGNCGPNSIIVRIALRNTTNNTVDLAGIRYGIQFNSSAVTLTGITSYMYNSGVTTGLNDPAHMTNPIGPDSGPTGTPDGDRVAPIAGGGSKTMTKVYYNRSTNVCENVWLLPPRTFRIAVDICFQLKAPKQLTDYGLEASPYGFGTSKFITQILSSPDATLTDPNKEIGIYLKTGAQDQNNPYQPFDLNNCNNLNFNPFTIGAGLNSISPINGILAGKAVDAKVADKSNHVQVQWQSENNQLIDYFEVQRKDDNGEYKTIGLVMGTDNVTEDKYEYKDKITVRDIESSYRIKVVGKDKITTYSNVQKIRLGGTQALSVKVYPNPSNDAVRINLPEPLGIYVCRLYSAEGRMVLTSNVSASNSLINIKTLHVGSYFMELYHPKTGMRYYTQFSKQ